MLIRQFGDQLKVSQFADWSTRRLDNSWISHLVRAISKNHTAII